METQDKTGGAVPDADGGKKKLSLVAWMGIAVVAGFAGGLGLLMFKASIGEQSDLWQAVYRLLFVDITTAEGAGGIGLLFDVQKLFLNALQLGIVPLVLCSLSLAIYNVQDTTKLGRIAGKTIALFAMYYAVCATLGVLVALAAKASGLFSVSLPQAIAGEAATVESYNPLTIMFDIVPSNLVAALGNNDAVLAVIFISVVIGVIMNRMPLRSRPVIGLLHSGKYIVEAYLSFVINAFAPFAIFCMIVRAFAIYGLEYLQPAIAYLVIGVVAGLAIMLLVFPVSVALATRKSPVTFMRKTLEMLLITAATTSSSAGFPANAEAAKNLGCPEDISSFVLPTGMVIHMPGTVVMQIMAVMFIATASGIDVQLHEIVIVALVCIVTAIATPTVPMAGTVMIWVALSAVGFTTDACALAYALIVAINYPVGMACITMNTLGDAATNVIVCKTEGELDEERYDA